MFCLSNLSYRVRLLSLKLDSLDVRRIKQDLIMCYTIINGLVAIDSSEFSFTDCDRTLGIIYSYIYRSVDLMSANLALLEECVQCGTLYHMML